VANIKNYLTIAQPIEDFPCPYRIWRTFDAIFLDNFAVIWRIILLSNLAPINTIFAMKMPLEK
jgi:hypothetical protein